MLTTVGVRNFFSRAAGLVGREPLAACGLAFFFLVGATTGLTGQQILTAAPSASGAVNLASTTGSEGSSLAMMRADATLGVQGVLPEAKGGTNAGALTCNNQFVTSNGTSYLCATDTLASAQHANQGTTTTVLHGNAAGNPSFGAVSLTADVTGVTPVANGGTNAATTSQNFVFSGPTSGSGAPAFRALVQGDYPLGSLHSESDTGGACSGPGVNITTITAATAGTYLITAATLITPVAGNTITISLQKNAGNIVGGTRTWTDGNSQPVVVSYSLILALAAADVIRFRCVGLSTSFGGFSLEAVQIQ